MNGEARRGFLKASDQAEIEAVWKRAELSDEEKAKRIFEVTFEARLRGLPTEEAEIIRRLAARRTRKASNVLDAQYLPLERRVVVDLPTEYFGSVVEYFQMSHEIAHAIQDLALVKKAHVDTERLFQETRHTDSYLRHLMEKGAVTEEYDFWKSIPRPERLKLMQAVGESDTLDSGSKRFLMQAIKNYFSNRDTYVARELGNRHYDLSFKVRLSAEILPAVQTNAAYQWVIMNPKKSVLGVASVVSTSSLLYICHRLKAARPGEGSSLKRLCPDL